MLEYTYLELLLQLLLELSLGFFKFIFKMIFFHLGLERVLVVPDGPTYQYLFTLLDCDILEIVVLKCLSAELNVLVADACEDRRVRAQLLLSLRLVVG